MYSTRDSSLTNCLPNKQKMYVFFIDYTIPRNLPKIDSAKVSSGCQIIAVVVNLDVLKFRLSILYNIIIVGTIQICNKY